MCCHDDAALDLPPAVIEMVARYRRMRAEQGVGWGEEAFPDMFRWARFARLGPAFDEFAASGDWAGAVRAAVGADVPAGLALVTVGPDGGLTARTGPPRPVVPGTTVQIDVVLHSTADRDLVVAVDGAEVPVPAGGAGLRTVDAAGPIVVTCGAARCTVDAVVLAAAATLRLDSPHGARWSITDGTGGAWFAEGVPAKWDSDDRPFFHTDPGTTDVTVPAGPLHVVAARGIEFARMEVDVTPRAGETVTVAYDPQRRFDPAADGWYGADERAAVGRCRADANRSTQHERGVTAPNCSGDGVEQLVLYGPDGVLATGAGELEHEVTVDGGLWLAAAAHGDTDPHTVGAPVFAHTTPVYVDVDGQRVGRAASARWCLRLLDGVEELAAEHGRFDPGHRERQLGDLIAVLDRARAFYRSIL